MSGNIDSKNQNNVLQSRQQYMAVLKTLTLLSVPTILEEVLSTLIQYVDTAMVGRLGEKATAAVSTTTTINWLIHAIPGAIAVAILAQAAKAMGAGQKERLKRIAGQGVLMAYASGILIEIVVLLLAPYIPVWMHASEDILPNAITYFTILSTTLVLRTSSRVLAATIRATKDTKTPMIISVSENVLNVVLNGVFIYGLGMGVKGAAIASAISYGVGGILMFMAFMRNEYLRISWSDLRPETSILKESVQIGTPALLTNIASCMGYVVFASMVSGMGTITFAAHSIAVAAEEIVYIPGYGLRLATSTLVGNALGEGDYKKLKLTERISIEITMLIMLFNGILLFIFATPLMGIFTPSSQVIELGAKVLKMVAFSEPFFGLMIVLEGIAYGKGQTKSVFYIETFSMWGIRIVLTYICVNVLALGLTAVWLCMIADNVFKASALALYTFVSGKKFEASQIS